MAGQACMMSLCWNCWKRIPGQHSFWTQQDSPLVEVLLLRLCIRTQHWWQLEMYCPQRVSMKSNSLTRQREAIQELQTCRDGPPLQRTRHLYMQVTPGDKLPSPVDGRLSLVHRSTYPRRRKRQDQMGRRSPSGHRNPSCQHSTGLMSCLLSKCHPMSHGPAVSTGHRHRWVQCRRGHPSSAASPIS